MSTPPPPHPAYQPPQGPYPQTPGPYAPAPGPYAPAPGPYQQAPGPYPPVPGAFPPAAAGPQHNGGGMPAGRPVAGMPMVACQVCGAVPAAPVTVRGHQGMLVIMRFLRRQGAFCRTCALAVFRDMQADTLIQGWWGVLSAFITPVTLLRNLGALSSIRTMSPPVTPGPRPPLDPGKPVFKRPQGILALIPLGLITLAALAVPVLIAIGLFTGPNGGGDDRPVLRVGSCAHNYATWPDQDLRAADCGSPDAQFRVLDRDDPDCGSLDFVAYPEYSSSGDVSLCLHQLKK